MLPRILQERKMDEEYDELQVIDWHALEPTAAPNSKLRQLEAGSLQ